ncbi:hypothetical protein UZ73_13975 [Alcaligenes faecalis]|nr:hypothetical protein UZ73_13975 [Alcaligenes faecalis]RSE65207.1 hypothetical protein EGT81_02775 [Alcaligenes faecalis]
MFFLAKQFEAANAKSIIIAALILVTQVLKFFPWLIVGGNQAATSICIEHVLWARAHKDHYHAFASLLPAFQARP